MSIPIEEYIMGRTSKEYQRLRIQAKDWEEDTRRVLLKAGLSAGMSCLDIGCGPGEAMRLMGEIVGPEGSITGIDIDGKIGREALNVLKTIANSQYSFLELDVESSDEVPGGPFDFTFTRITLLHLKDSVEILRKMMKWTKPGGVVVAQEYDLESAWKVYPELDELAEAVQTFRTFLKKAGRDAQVGLKLPAHFIEAGLGIPDGTDVAASLQDLNTVVRITRDAYESVFPMAKSLGITDEASRHRILSAIDKAADTGGFYVLSPSLIGAWKRRPNKP